MPRHQKTFRIYEISHHVLSCVCISDCKEVELPRCTQHKSQFAIIQNCSDAGSPTLATVKDVLNKIIQVSVCYHSEAFSHLSPNRENCQYVYNKQCINSSPSLALIQGWPGISRPALTLPNTKFIVLSSSFVSFRVIPTPLSQLVTTQYYPDMPLNDEWRNVLNAIYKFSPSQLSLNIIQHKQVPRCI